MSMIAAVLRLDRAAVQALQITDPYSLHRVIYSLFPDVRDDATKARQSTAAMMRIEGALQSVGATSAKRIILGDQEASPKDALLMVAGLRAIIEGQR